MTNAIRLGEDFLLPHALYAFGTMGADAGSGVAQRALALIERRELTEISRRDLQRELGLATVEQADVAIQVLEEHGYLREKATDASIGKPGRKPSPVYEGNPLVPEVEKTPKQFDVFDRTPAAHRGDDVDDVMRREVA